MRLPTAKTVYREVTCTGGPWAGQKARFPVQDSSDPLSLPINVNGWRGRYDLNKGKWVPSNDELLARDKVAE